MSNAASNEVTIGLPVFNGEAYLRQAIGSLLGQSHSNLKLVIFDNASTDKTQEICRAFQSQDERVEYIRNATNIGATENFSLALSHADTSYFMWAAHDDYWHRDFVRTCLEALEAKPESGFAFPLFSLRSTRWRVQKKVSGKIFDFITSKDRRIRVLTAINTHPGSHMCNLVYSLFRTKLIREAYERHDISNDGLLATTILGLSKGELIEQYLFYKQYKNLWPSPSHSRKISFDKAQDFVYQRDATFAELSLDFPELQEEIEIIRTLYKPNEYLENFRILPQQELLQRL